MHRSAAGFGVIEGIIAGAIVLTLAATGWVVFRITVKQETRLLQSSQQADGTTDDTDH